MAHLNITYNGFAVDYGHVDDRLSDADIKRVAVESLRSGLPGLRAQVGAHAFDHFVVDRIHAADGKMRIYLRPKVPFG
jgi:hypothetical protein